jgi:hypothetical protein
MLETASILPAETEEEPFRLKNIRLAEKGFLPPHEAIGIYQPTPLAALRQRPRSQAVAFDPTLPQPPQCFSRFLQGEDLFVQVLKKLDPDLLFSLESEIAALINKVISADRIKIRDRESMEKAIHKTTAYLSLGIEAILKEARSPETAPEVIEKYFLEDIFRTGSRAGIQLKAQAEKWYQKSFIQQAGLALSFLSETYLGVLGGLFLDRPLFFANYREGTLYRNFKSLDDIARTREVVEQIIHMDRFLGQLPLDLSTFTSGTLTCKSLVLTAWVRNRTGLDPDDQCTLAPIPLSRFKPFFADLFTRSDSDADLAGTIDPVKKKDLILWAAQVLDQDEKKLPPPLTAFLSGLIQTVEKEYGTVSVHHIDPRFMPHFLLGKDVDQGA